MLSAIGKAIAKDESTQKESDQTDKLIININDIITLLSSMKPPNSGKLTYFNYNVIDFKKKSYETVMLSLKIEFPYSIHTNEKSGDSDPGHLDPDLNQGRDDPDGIYFYGDLTTDKSPPNDDANEGHGDYNIKY